MYDIINALFLFFLNEDLKYFILTIIMVMPHTLKLWETTIIFSWFHILNMYSISDSLLLFVLIAELIFYSLKELLREEKIFEFYFALGQILILLDLNIIHLVNPRAIIQILVLKKILMFFYSIRCIKIK